MVVTDSSTLMCIFEILLKTYKELSRPFGYLERLNLGGLNQVCKCKQKNNKRTYLISIFFLGLSSTEQMIRSCANPESFFIGGPTFFTPTLFF